MSFPPQAEPKTYIVKLRKSWLKEMRAPQLATAQPTHATNLILTQVKALARAAWPGKEALHVLRRALAVLLVQKGQRTKSSWVMGGQQIGEGLGGPESPSR